MLGSQDIEEGNHQMEDGCREVTCEEVICSVTVITLDGNQAFIEMIDHRAKTSPDTVSRRWRRPSRSAPSDVLYSVAARNSGARAAS